MEPAIQDDRAVVLYDGHCAMCLRWAERLRRRDRGHRLVLFSLHDPVVGRRYPGLEHHQLMQQLHVCSPAGRWYEGAAALRYLSRRLPRLWWLMPLMHLPFSGPLWNRLYARVATSRDTCDDEDRSHG